MPLLILLLLFFALELGLFIELGSQIGILATLLEIVVSAVIGVQLIRLTGFRVLQEMQAGMVNQWWLQVRQQTIARRMFAGLLLIAPGFATDALGLVLLVWSWMGPSGPRTPPPGQDQQTDPTSGRVIEGDYERRD
ncbi:FxsA family protein [Natronospirillum operosum]|uniref:FxsA family protein n=1 Tax=Natronospirillum operosum TaxID=2759953 RepID=A0A4Z0WI07_9GAMM|nr:FxsA family protein [Natronospirillum operosum]TGG95003.1 FxsA family protein [Natronospirillum operosum]